jgi:hypothetical protein
MNPLDIPLYFYSGLEGIYVWVQTWPWPAPSEYFGSMVLFITLYPIRTYLEKRYLKKKFRRQSATTPPSNGDHQAASSIIGHTLH